MANFNQNQDEIEWSSIAYTLYMPASFGCSECRRISEPAKPEPLRFLRSLAWVRGGYGHQRYNPEKYDGMSPEELEGRVVRVYEGILTTTVNDIEHIESQSINGEAIIRVYFQPGAKITVRYDPRRPENALLNLATEPLWRIGCGTTFGFFIGVGMCVLSQVDFAKLRERWAELTVSLTTVDPVRGALWRARTAYVPAVQHVEGDEPAN